MDVRTKSRGRPIPAVICQATSEDGSISSSNDPFSSIPRQVKDEKDSISAGIASKTSFIDSMTSEIDPGIDENGSMTTLPSMVPDEKRPVQHENDRAIEEIEQETEEIEQETEEIEQETEEIERVREEIEQVNEEIDEAPEENDRETKESVETSEVIEEALTESERRPWIAATNLTPRGRRAR